MNHKIACLGLFSSVVLLGLSMSFAEPNSGISGQTHGFGVVIRLFHGTEKGAIAEHLILFDDDVIYAIPSDPQQQITVIDQTREVVILLDRSTQTRTSIGLNDLLVMTAQLRNSASTEELRHRLGINAEINVDETSHVFAVTYGGIQYSTTTQQPADPEQAAQFGHFCDWASRLNIARKLGMPPFGRMRMNSQIAAAGRLPAETQLQYQQGESTFHYRSTHEISTAITAADRDRIDEVAGMMTLYKSLPFSEFAE